MARTTDKLLKNRRCKQILDGAAECFVINGFHQTGMKQICVVSGLSAGSVYHYFENKDAIIEGIADSFDSDTRKFFKILNKRKDFAKDFIKASKARFKETQYYVRYGRLVVEIITKAIESKQIHGNHEPKMLAHTLIALVEGIENRILQYPKIKLAKLVKPFEHVCNKLLKKPE